VLKSVFVSIKLLRRSGAGVADEDVTECVLCEEDKEDEEDEEDREVCEEEEKEEEEEECWYSVVSEVKRPRIVWRSLEWCKRVKVDDAVKSVV